MPEKRLVSAYLIVQSVLNRGEEKKLCCIPVLCIYTIGPKHFLFSLYLLIKIQTPVLRHTWGCGGPINPDPHVAKSCLIEMAMRVL